MRLLLFQFETASNLYCIKLQLLQFVTTSNLFYFKLRLLQIATSLDYDCFKLWFNHQIIISSFSGFWKVSEQILKLLLWPNNKAWDFLFQKLQKIFFKLNLPFFHCSTFSKTISSSHFQNKNISQNKTRLFQRNPWLVTIS